jgi:uncharacterized phiE125 gp8 family phage protein
MLTESWISQFVTVSETEPTYEPVTVNEAKNYFKVDDTTDDALIAQIIKTARKMIETQASLAFHRRTVTQKQTGGIETLDALRIPVFSVTSLQYAENFDSTYETIDTDEYRLAGNKLFHDDYKFKRGRDADGYVITYVAGMVADATPSTLNNDMKIAILRVAAFLYENRQEYAQGWSEQGFSINYESNGVALLKDMINRIVNPYASAKGIF